MDLLSMRMPVLRGTRFRESYALKGFQTVRLGKGISRISIIQSSASHIIDRIEVTNDTLTGERVLLPDESDSPAGFTVE